MRPQREKMKWQLKEKQRQKKEKETKSAQRVNRIVGDTDKCMLRYKHTDYT